MLGQGSKPKCCAVILSGGLNTRMGGRNKAFLKIGEKTILDRTLKTLQDLFEEILLVTRQPDLYAGQPVRVVEDIFKARSSLTGIHAGLINAQADFAFVVPCDAPFLKPDPIRMLIAEIRPDSDVIVPVFKDHYEPLFAIYSKRCIQSIEDQLNHGDFKIINIFDKVNLRTIPVEKIVKADSEMHSFFNVNTPDALQVSQNMLEGK